MEYILQTEDLCKRYWNFRALNKFNMNIPKGSIYGFVGRNGSGKTTLIRIISGLQTPSSGEFTLYGKKNTDKNIRNARRRIGAVVETPAIYMNMTAEENIRQQYNVLGLPSYDGIDELLKLVGLENTGKKKAKNFSLGMRQRLGIAVALAGNPDFLILDEPINGLDPQGIVEIRELILKLNKEHNMTVLISSHILGELSLLATHYGFIDHGQMIKEISAEELEKSCRKCKRIKVSDINSLIIAFDKLGIEYSVTESNTADIFSDINVTMLVNALSAENCEVLNITENDESLESYFVNLVGGEK